MPGLALAQHAKLPRRAGLEQGGQGLLLDGSFHVDPLLSRSNSTQGIDIAQSRHPATRLALRFHQAVDTAKELAAQAKGEWSYWAKWQFIPSGRLQVLVNEGYGGKIVDSDSRPVELQLNKLIGLMAARAVEFLVRKERQAVEDAERQELSMEQLELLRWGRAKADWIDPLKPFPPSKMCCRLAE